MRALFGLHAFAFAIGMALPACDEAPEGSTQVACTVDRDCQDGDLCDGAERCLGGVCAAGMADDEACASDLGAACGGRCAPHERCASEVCTSACLPPIAPVLARLPVGIRLPFPAGALVSIDGGGSLAAPSSPGTLDPDQGVTFTRPGPVAIEAHWAASEVGCEASSFRATYEVVAELDTEPTRAPDAIAAEDPRIYAWAAGWAPPRWGGELDPAWQDPTRALGPATGTWDDATSLGNGGALTMVFEAPIADGPGPDLAVFENGFSESFLELAFVEVSSNGEDFVRFAALSLQRQPVAAYGALDPGEVIGVAGRFRAGFGVAFDLETLAQAPEVLTGRVDLTAVTHVRVVDVVGDGASLDALGHPIYDPTPTFGPAGFDLEAIGAIAPLGERSD